MVRLLHFNTRIRAYLQEEIHQELSYLCFYWCKSEKLWCRSKN